MQDPSMCLYALNSSLVETIIFHNKYRLIKPRHLPDKQLIKPNKHYSILLIFHNFMSPNLKNFDNEKMS